MHHQKLKNSYRITYPNLSLNHSPNQGSAGPGFVNQDRDREISPFSPANEIGTGILYLESQCHDRDREWIITSPANETGMGPYLVPGLSKVPGIFFWSRK